jgi:predicted nucleotidyltransferase component of viral defense system
MLSFQEILRQYPSDLHRFKRGLVREYLQYQILGIIFRHKLGIKLSFLGGTCLRIIYKSKRFSEDLDFDNKDLSEDEFVLLSKHIKKELEKLGFIVEIDIKVKKAFHCYIKFPQLLHGQGLLPLTQEKLLIQLDMFDQEINYKTEISILDKFDLYDQIIVTPKSVILSQKLWTIVQRKNAKGRDFFDAMYLFGQTKPDLEFLSTVFGTKNSEEVKKIILTSLESIDWDRIIRDLNPFVLSIEDAEKIRIFPQFLRQVRF